MSEISTIVGQRIRSRRRSQKLTQEKLAHLSNCHPTYIGQLERGEKSPTLPTLERICRALQYPMSELLEKIEDFTGDDESREKSIPLRCYEIICTKPESEQEKLLRFIMEIDRFSK